ncbi:uncharacterized protein LOC125369305 [Ricinus communis]|uniref:uncharacterized protein LOC125369305 n=1 Tax=Ricinus communis TaxID=3988 RepID=UPI00201AC03B|nr:uncharacterized protein LOC125369305 [Ricinus communis]
MGRLCVLNVEVLKREITEEAQNSAYAMHPGSTKMYHTLKDNYWRPGMKKNIVEFVNKCLVCQQVNAEHQHPAGILLTKSAQCLPENVNYSLDKLAETYIQEVVRLHGVPFSIVSDMDPMFTSSRGLSPRVYSIGVHLGLWTEEDTAGEVYSRSLKEEQPVPRAPGTQDVPPPSSDIPESSSRPSILAPSRSSSALLGVSPIEACRAAITRGWRRSAQRFHSTRGFSSRTFTPAEF